MTAAEKNDLRYRCARDICAFLGFDRRSMAIYGTSYGFSIDSFRGTSPLLKKVEQLLESAGVAFKLGAGSLHDEIRVSTRGDNLQKFKKLADDCWARVMSIDGKLLDELVSLAGKVDTESPYKLSRLNTLVRIKEYVADRVRRFRDGREWFDAATEVEALKKFLPVQNDLDACFKFLEGRKNANFGDYNKIDFNVYFHVVDEIHRLTGERPE